MCWHRSSSCWQTSRKPIACGIPITIFTPTQGCQISISIKRQTLFLKSQKKAKRFILWPGENPNFCGIAVPLSQTNTYIKRKSMKFSSKLRLTLACLPSGAHSRCYPDILWFARLHTLNAMVPTVLHTDPSVAFCTHTKVISHSLLYLRSKAQGPLHFLDVIVAFISQRRRPVCKRWACIVFGLTTHCIVHTFPEITQKVYSESHMPQILQHQNVSVGLV